MHVPTRLSPGMVTGGHHSFGGVFYEYGAHGDSFFYWVRMQGPSGKGFLPVSLSSFQASVRSNRNRKNLIYGLATDCVKSVLSISHSLLRYFRISGIENVLHARLNSGFQLRMSKDIEPLVTNGIEHSLGNRFHG